MDPRQQTAPCRPSRGSALPKADASQNAQRSKPRRKRKVQLPKQPSGLVERYHERASLLTSSEMGRAKEMAHSLSVALVTPTRVRRMAARIGMHASNHSLDQTQHSVKDATNDNASNTCCVVQRDGRMSLLS